ncbi:PREDICTED: mitogen-activated protein kinase kinase kinase 14-like [Acropora digitifera]|uniref:mitogen-activated protein kinase kinase kinase 14-like n=1 Tax=Acropora digitifera TaxID=70779 RepID=UPI00077B24FB|nr:PREDICTED: mitogen-activated protein kinase kinase kinase 14-like [Acropora digitifera]
MSVTEAQSFYSSTEWAVKIDNTLNSYAPVPLPFQPNHSTRNHSSVPTTPDVPASNSSPRVLTPIIIPPHYNVNVTYWSFSYIISQSTILGRLGSNACTLIALLFSKMFFSPNVDIPLSESSLSQTWVYQIILQAMLAGNSIYDSLTDIPQTFDVLEVLQASTVLNNAIGYTTVGPELPETFSIHDGHFKEGTHYFVLEKIGSGAFGECYKAYTSNDPSIFCVKKTKYKVNELLALHLAKEGKVETIVDYYGAKLQSGNAVIFMEYMKGGTLERHIKKQKNELAAGTWPIIAEETCLVFVRDIFTALDFLYSKGLFHGDIKGENILLYEDGRRLKLADFGSAGDIQEPGGVSNDVWRTACLALEMLNGEFPLIFCVGGPLRQKFVKDGKHLPPNATETTKKWLNFIFGAGQEHLPSPAEILKFLTTLN